MRTEGKPDKTCGHLHQQLEVGKLLCCIQLFLLCCKTRSG